MDKNQLEDLLGKMTLDEKISQMMQLSPIFFKGTEMQGEITGPMEELNLTESIIQNAGSVLGSSSKKDMLQIQEEHMKTNRLGIPLVFMADIIHGHKTIFPIPLALGASFSEEVASEMARVSALEATASGHHVTFSPMVDLVRDPRWGRVMESTGEDPHLNSRLGAAMVRGYQGGNLQEDYTRLAACVKHFAAYGAPQGGREYHTVDMSKREFYQNYLPAYQAALEAGAKMVMTSFNVLEGVPATMNKWLNRDVLRQELGFSGVLISDWGAVKEVINHGTAADTKEAAKGALLAGVDLEMMTECFITNLKELVETGEVSEGLLDEAVMRMLVLKEELGLFKDPYRGLKRDSRSGDILSDENRQVARNVAHESAVLLKNNANILPLAFNQKIALIGPLADSQDVLGGWVVYGEQKDAVSMADAFSGKFSATEIVSTDYEQISENVLQEAETAAKNADVVVLCVGEKSEWSGEAASLATIRLPEAQYELAKRVAKANSAVVTVLFNGRPLDIHDLVDHSEAVLDVFFPGTEAGNAIFDLLTGEVNPSGKLSMTIPQTTGQIPIFYNELRTGRPKTAQNAGEKYLSQYLDIPNEPLFPFGFGLSYTNFVLSEMEVADEIALADTLHVKVTVQNTGECAGSEVIQVYLQDITASVSRPLKELKAFQKVRLEPGEKTTLSFALTKEDFSFYLPDLTVAQEAGLHRVFIGTSSVDVKSFEVRVVR
ncbi:glycoside hydrolase family 3 N-terminal domain-containing protein [Listeria goaensis]|uniref:glycoside hydrolase family 3 N-terminal domain-containing protein n=1 Tax=Listeria goaensis TaxID=1649188 RepID=UPI000B58E9FB|nr:glycoside hydrolase family 3 N-terminal domain-containing protein [Listeria goaensis]